MKSVEAELTFDLGGDPSAAERLLVQSVAVKATRLALLADQLLDGVEIQSDQHNVLAWSNSLRHDLQALGLQRRSKDVTPTLAEYLAAKATVNRLAMLTPDRRPTLTPLLPLARTLQ